MFFFPLQVAPANPKTVAELSDAQLLHLLTTGTLSPHKLESDLNDATRAVHLRRLYTAYQLNHAPEGTKTATDAYKAFAALPEHSFDIQT